MTNEELALAIRNGERFLYAQLWKQTQRFLRKLSNRYLNTHALPTGFDFEDCLQCGYIALVRAVETYDPEKEYRLLSYLWNNLRNVIREELSLRSGSHTINICSYNAPLEDDGETELLDTLEDETAAAPLDQAELTDTQQLVHEAVDRLPQRQALTIKLLFYHNCNRKETAERMQTTEMEVASLREKALRSLRKDQRLLSLFREYTRHYTHYETPVSFYSSGAYQQAIDAIERRRESGFCFSYGKEKSLLYAARRSFMEELKEQDNLM